MKKKVADKLIKMIMPLDVVATYTKYKKSPFFVQAYNLCPHLHRGDDYCAMCESLTDALEKAYQVGWRDASLSRKIK